jgi:hypothetical protein
LVSVLVLARIGGTPGGVRLMSVQALVVQAAAMSGGIIMGVIAEWLPMATAPNLPWPARPNIYYIRIPIV